MRFVEFIVDVFLGVIEVIESVLKLAFGDDDDDNNGPDLAPA